MNNDYWSPETLAEHWGITVTTLSDWRVRGIGPVFLKLGGRVRYRHEDVQQYEMKCLRQSTSQSVLVEK